MTSEPEPNPNDIIAPDQNRQTEGRTSWFSDPAESLTLSQNSDLQPVCQNRLSRRNQNQNTTSSPPSVSPIIRKVLVVVLEGIKLKSTDFYTHMHALSDVITPASPPHLHHHRRFRARVILPVSAGCAGSVRVRVGVQAVGGAHRERAAGVLANPEHEQKQRERAHPDQYDQ